MEKKTLGAFLAVLRRASGMTQAELAAKLNVSDKAVSRWERDESAPDLTLIPVIAEIFDVTADELLRGERIVADKEKGERIAAQSEKQRQWLLRRSRDKLLTRTILPVGLCAGGMLGAMIANFGFQRAYLGFFIACVFYVAAILSETVFLLWALSAVGGDDIDAEQLQHYRRAVAVIAEWGIAVAVILFAASLPLVVFPWDAYLGVEGIRWLMYGAFGGVVAAAVCGVVIHLINQRLFPRSFADRKAVARLQRRCFIPLLGVLLVTLLGQLIFNSLCESSTFAAGTAFDNWAAFKAFMETVPEDSTDEDLLYVDMETITAPDGRVLCTYYMRNQAVVQFECGDSDDLLPVTVYTHEELADGQTVRNILNGAWAALYVVEIAVGYGLYRRRTANVY